MEFKRNIRILYIIEFISSFTMIKVISTLFYQANGMSLYKIGIILGIYQVTKFLFEIPTGIIADKYGRKISVFLGYILFMLFLVITFMFRNFIGFSIACILQGISYTFLSGANEALFVDSVILLGEEDKLNKYNSINRIIFYSAIGLGSLIGGFVATYSYDAVYIITILIQIIPIILILFVKEPNVQNKQNNEVRKISTAIVTKYLLNNNIILYILIIDIAISVSMIPIDSYYSNYLKTFGISEFLIGLIICIQYLMGSFTGILSNKLKNKLGSNLIIKVSPIIMISTFIVFALSKNIFAVVIIYLSGLIVFSLFAPIKYELLHKNLDSKYRATVLSLKSIIMSIIATIVQPVFGLIADTLNFSYAFIILLIVSLLVLFINNFIFSNELKQYEQICDN